METVSAAEREGRQEIVVTGKDSSFDTLVIAQMFPGVVNISKLDLGTRNVNGETVTDCRIGFEWRGRAPDFGENILLPIPAAWFVALMKMYWPSKKTIRQRRKHFILSAGGSSFAVWDFYRIIRFRSPFIMLASSLFQS